MSKVPYFPLYPTDFLADTFHLGNTELGIYWRLLLTYYRDRRPLPADREHLRRLAMAFSPEENKLLDEILCQFFVLGVDEKGEACWRQSRADREIQKAAHAYETRIENVRKARKNNPKNSKSKQEHNQGIDQGLEQGRHQGLAEEPEPEPELELKTRTRTRTKKPPVPSPGVPIWESYETAYVFRYRVPPVRNAKVNSQLKKLHERIGADAPSLAAFYLRQNRTDYVRSKHTVDLLLRDCEGLMTDYRRGVSTTDTGARETDRLSETAAMIDRVKDSFRLE